MVSLLLFRPAIFGLHLPIENRSRRWNFFYVPRAADAYKSAPHFEAAEAATISPRLFCFGIGYTGRAICATLYRKGWDLSGTSRQPPHSTADAQQTSVKTYEFDPARLGSGLSEEGREALRTATHVLSTIAPYSNGADLVLEYHRQDILEAASKALTWIGYISTTSVYGDWKGEWVDESSELRPFDAKSLARVEAECDWLSLGGESDAAAHVFRCGGIYGPGRSVLDVVENPRPESSSQRRRGAQKYVSRCHVADICRVIEASIADPRNGDVYNVVDDFPASRQEVLAFAALLLEAKSDGRGASQTHFRSQISRKIEKGEHPREIKNVKEGHLHVRASLPEKRVHNYKIRKELQVSLKYPSYKEGLFAIALGSKDPYY